LNRQQIDVDQLYVDVYVLEKLSSESYATIPDLLKGSDLRDGFERLGLGKREKRSPGFEVAAQYRRLMILGKPGSGKSTFLRHLAVACCKGEFQAERIPILIELRDIKDATRFDLLNRIHKEFGLANQAQTEQILNQGKVLILLDGLDEVSDQSRRDVQDHIYEFSQQYYKNRFILTCRTQTTEYALPMFDYVEVADFNPEQVKIFTQHWFSAFAETPKQGEKLSVQLLEKLSLPENEPTAELAVTPILLSLTCWVFTCLKDLPAKRSDLYEQGINLLLEKWDEKRGVRRELGSAAYRKLSMREKQRLLSYIASRKFTQEQYVLLEQSEIQGYISEYLSISTQDSQAMLEAIETQHGLLIERAYSIYSFSHLTFQEYFTAKWFVENADWQGLVSQITENHWREVFLLAVGACNNANHLLQLMKQQVDILIAADKNLQQFLIWLTEKSQSVETKCNPVAIRAFYFSLELYFNYGDVDYAYDLPARTLDSDLPEWLNFELEQGLIAPLYDNLEPDLALDVILTDPHYLFDFGLERTLSLKLRRALQKLYIPHYYQYDEDEEGTEEWWNRIGVWKPIATLAVPINQLRTVLIEHRNFGHNWCFTEEQEKLLKQYYDTNKLLVACLNGGCVVSDEVKKEIEDTLLLPIAEVEKRQQQRQVTDVANE
jgi:predicted NACHT family NTPase